MRKASPLGHHGPNQRHRQTGPTSARHGIHWWQIDASYSVIRLLAMAGLAWNIRLPARGAAAA
jgi:fatty-acid desaturase